MLASHEFFWEIATQIWNSEYTEQNFFVVKSYFAIHISLINPFCILLDSDSRHYVFHCKSVLYIALLFIIWQNTCIIKILSIVYSATISRALSVKEMVIFNTREGAEVILEIKILKNFGSLAFFTLTFRWTSKRLFLGFRDLLFLL